MALLLRRHFEHAAARCADGGDECAQGADGRDEAADARAGEHGPGVVDAFGKGVVVTFEGLFDDIDDDVEVDKEEEGGNRGAGWEGRGAGSERRAAQAGRGWSWSASPCSSGTTSWDQWSRRVEGLPRAWCSVKGCVSDGGARGRREEAQPRLPRVRGPGAREVRRDAGAWRRNDAWHMREGAARPETGLGMVGWQHLQGAWVAAGGWRF